MAAALVGAAAMPAAAGELGPVKEGTFTIKDLRLATGAVMPEAKIAYETYGTLAPDGRNAILVTHGYTSSHHAASHGKVWGWWDGLIGPGKAIDTDRVFVVTSNVLGSSHGSSNGASADPATGKPYGPDFPDIRLADMVAAERALLDDLGVKHLVAVAGPSYGGYQAFQWSVAYPEFMDGIVAVVTAPYSEGAEKGVADLKAQLATDPNWNGGRYYGTAGPLTVMTAMRVSTLKRYGIEAQLAEKLPDKAAREAEIERQARGWAQEFDASSLVILRQAMIGFDVRPEFPKIKAKLLYVLSRTDKLFPPSIAPAVMEKLKAAGVDARYVEIDSELGHSASGLDWHKWAPELKAFIEPLVPKST